jgi:hypothetical protein
MMKPAEQKTSIDVLREKRQNRNTQPVGDAHNGYSQQDQKDLFPPGGEKKVSGDEAHQEDRHGRVNPAAFFFYADRDIGKIKYQSISQDRDSRNAEDE